MNLSSSKMRFFGPLHNFSFTLQYFLRGDVFGKVTYNEFFSKPLRRPWVDFTNILRAAFVCAACRFLKQKRHWWLDCFFCFWNLQAAHTKAARKMLVKSTQPFGIKGEGKRRIFKLLSGSKKIAQVFSQQYMFLYT